MNTHILNNKVRYWGIGLSVLFHSILAALFLQVHLHQQVVIPEFAEMIMPSGYVIPSESELESESGEQLSRARNDMLPENIELPEKMELKEDDQLSRLQHQKNIEDLKPAKISEKQVETPALQSGRVSLEEPAIDHKSTPDFGFSKPTLRPAEEISGAGSEVEKVYSIQWEGGFQREVLYEVLPDVSDIQAQEAEIKLTIFVEPDGTVSIVQPLQKGGMIRLENAAIEALKKWRFNPVAAGGGQAQQKGIISFKFISK